MATTSDIARCTAVHRRGPLPRRGVGAAFENVHVYELLCRVLGLRPAQTTAIRASPRDFIPSEQTGPIRLIATRTEPIHCHAVKRRVHGRATETPRHRGKTREETNNKTAEQNDHGDSSIKDDRDSHPNRAGSRFSSTYCPENWNPHIVSGSSLRFLCVSVARSWAGFWSRDTGSSAEPISDQPLPQIFEPWGHTLDLSRPGHCLCQRGGERHLAADDRVHHFAELGGMGGREKHAWAGAAAA